MRVGVDARHLGGGRGVAHYTSGLLAALAERFPEDEWRAFVPGGSGPAEPSGAGGGSGGAEPGGAGGGSGGGEPRAAGGIDFVRGRFGGRAVFGAAAVAGRPRLDELLGGDVDVVWIPAPAPVAISEDVPYVLTVHDLSWLERPRDFTLYERVWHRVARVERLARNAAVVVAVSHATKRAIEERWPGVERIRVVHNAVPPLPQPAPRADWLAPRYFLAVGALEPRKAPDLLARAFARARREGLGAELVFAGDGRLAKHVRNEPGVTVIDVADRATLAMLYANAVALVLPSFSEGFGFTPLEAASLGTPAIVSDLPVFDETLGDDAVRVPPGDVEAWANALLRGPNASVAGVERFTPRAAAEGIHAALTEALR